MWALGVTSLVYSLVRLDWKPFAAFPPEARLAVVVGHPTEPGLYVIRVKLPDGAKMMRTLPLTMNSSCLPEVRLVTEARS